eukprot:scaffold222261_cov39-Tisochrysis_lutea.AAC.1
MVHGGLRAADLNLSVPGSYDHSPPLGMPSDRGPSRPGPGEARGKTMAMAWPLAAPPGTSGSLGYSGAWRDTGGKDPPAGTGEQVHPQSEHVLTPI